NGVVVPPGARRPFQITEWESATFVCVCSLRNAIQFSVSNLDGLSWKTASKPPAADKHTPLLPETTRLIAFLQHFPPILLRTQAGRTIRAVHGDSAAAPPSLS